MHGGYRETFGFGLWEVGNWEHPINMHGCEIHRILLFDSCQDYYLFASAGEQLRPFVLCGNKARLLVHHPKRARRRQRSEGGGSVGDNEVIINA